MTSEPKRSVDVLMEEAALWHARMDSGTGDLAEFEQWRNADPRHAAAFARILGTAHQIHRLKPALKRQSLVPSRRGLIRAVAATITVAAVGAGTVMIVRGGRVSARTQVGDNALRVLPDGSRLLLNTSSKAEWRFDGHRREVWLKDGEIALSIPDDPRPLYLYGANQIVEAHSGRFNARLRNGALDLLVLEGSATIRPKAEEDRSSSPRIISAGNAVLAVNAEARPRAMTVNDIQFVSAWQNGDVYFNGQTLAAAVEEYNRYLPYKIVIGDPSLQGIQLGGRFKSRDPKLFLTSLNTAFRVNATQTENGSIILTR